LLGEGRVGTMSTTSVARDAFESFHSGNNAKCEKLLDQISGFKTSVDVKVAHNKLINEYYKSGCADPQHLLTQLTQAYDKARERDKKDKSRKKRDEEEEEAYREDEDLGVLRYNQALICLQLRQHAQATLILEELFENIEPIDDFLAIKICFLLLELCLLQREPEQAVAVLAYLEKPAAFNTVLRSERPTPKVDATSSVADAEGGEAKGGDTPNDAMAVVIPEPPKVVSASVKPAGEGEPPEGPLPSLTVGAFLPKHGRAPDTISRAEYRFFCNMYRARVNVALKNTKSAKKDVKNAMEVLESELRHAPLLTPHPHTTGTPKDEGGTALQDALQRQQHAIVNMFKAYLEYTRQNARKAMKLLTLCQFNFAESKGDAIALADDKSSKSKRKGSADDDEEQIPIDFHPAQDGACAPFFFNNLGCIHFLMHKPSLAAFYFQKALHAMAPSSEPMGKAGLRLPGVLATKHWLDRRAEVAYNAGLQMLMSDQPAAAFKCFEQCAPVFRTWPRLWIRMAECCIELHRQSLNHSDGNTAESTHCSTATGWSRLVSRSPVSGVRRLMWGVQGGSAHRRWLLSTTRDLPIGRRAAAGDEDEGVVGKTDGKAHAAESETDGLAGQSSLLQASMCLRNVLILVTPMLPERFAAGSSDGTADGNLGGASANASGSQAGGKEAAVAAGAASGSTRAAKASAPAGSSQKLAGPSGGGPRHQARDLLESEASLLEDSALVKLAYVSLCQRDYTGALRYSRRLLEKNVLLSQPVGSKANEEVEDTRKSWAFQAQNLPQPCGTTGTSTSSRQCSSSIACVTLAVLYAAEALLILGRPQEARSLLGSFISSDATSRSVEVTSTFCVEQHVIGAGSARRTSNAPLRVDPNDEGARRCCGGVDPTASLGGLSPPGYILQCLGSSASQPSKERGEGKGDIEKEKNSSKDSIQAALVMYPPSEFTRLGETQCMLYTNLAALHVQDDKLDEAEAACEKALRVQPHALAPLRTLVYILLRKGNSVQALRRLKQSRL